VTVGGRLAGAGESAEAQAATPRNPMSCSQVPALLSSLRADRTDRAGSRSVTPWQRRLRATRPAFLEQAREHGDVPGFVEDAFQ